MEEKLRDFYMREYPGDELGYGINPDANFRGLFKALKERQDVYEFIGVGERIVRERLFSRLSKIMVVSYGEIYDLWLNR